MAAYPDLPITDAQTERLTGILTRVTRSGQPRSVTTQTATPVRFQLAHDLISQSDAATLTAFYDNNDTFTFTWEDGVTYDCIWDTEGANAQVRPPHLWTGTAVFIGTPQ